MAMKSELQRSLRYLSRKPVKVLVVHNDNVDHSQTRRLQREKNKYIDTREEAPIRIYAGRIDAALWWVALKICLTEQTDTGEI